MSEISIYDKAEDQANRIFENHSQHCQETYDYVEDILEEDFDGLSAFFKTLLEKQYSAIILMSRRCLVLFQLFMFLFRFKGVKLQIPRVILSDRALPAYFDAIKEGGKVAIVDDIIVHGRAISKVYNLIKEVCSNVEIDVYSYMADRNLTCISQDLKRELNVDYYASTNEWRKLSNKIVDTILVSGTPYTSFVMAYYQYDKCSLFQAMKDNDNLQVVYNLDADRNKNRITSSCIYDINWNKPKLFSKLSLGECVRVYYSPKTGKYTVIPYVFIRSLNIEDADELFISLGNMIPEEYAGIRSILLSRKDTETQVRLLREYKLRILTCLLSQLYWEIFRGKYSLPDLQFRDIDTIINGFGPDVAEELCGLSLDKFETLLNIDLSISPVEAAAMENTAVVDDSESPFEGLLAEEDDRQVSFAEKLKDFLWFAWGTDERKARRGEDRGNGLTIDAYIQIAKKKGIELYQVLSALVNSWDIGTAGANFTTIVDKKMIGCCVTCGEQSYRYVLEKYPGVMNALITVSNRLTKGAAAAQGLSYEKYREGVLLDLLSEFSDENIITNHYYQYLVDIIKSDKGYLNAWNQISVLRSDVASDQRIEEIMRKIYERDID